VGSWEDRKKHGEKRIIETILIKSFWESRTLFSKRVLAAGGKSDGEFRENLILDFFYFIG